MIRQMLEKFVASPIEFLKLAVNKMFIGPLKYGKKDDYDAASYWRDRLSKHGTNAKGPGEEGFSESSNLKRYERITSLFKDLCRGNVSRFEDINVLEIGTGTGLITKSLYELGVKHYIGLDITDALFPMLTKRYSAFKFKKSDITIDELKEKFDLIVIIDVIEHIVNEAKFNFAMNNLKNSLSKGGVIIIAPLAKKGKKYLYYERHWTYEDLRKVFTSDYAFSELLPWEKDFSYVTVIKKRD